MAKVKVLVVEDEPIAARHIQKALGTLGYSVEAVVPSGEAAVTKAEQIQPDLVLMDIILEGDMDGVQAAERIRSRFDIPAIFLTASSDPATFTRAKTTDPFGYIVKPFEEKALHTTIELALYKHQMESTLKSKVKEVEALYAVARVLAQPWSFEEKCKGILEALAQIGGADLTTMRVLAKDKQGMELVVTAGPASWNGQGIEPLNGSICGAAFQSRRTVAVNDYPSHPLADSAAVAKGIKSLVSVPINADRWTLGVMSLVSREPDHFPPRLVQLLSGIADGLAVL